MSQTANLLGPGGVPNDGGETAGASHQQQVDAVMREMQESAEDAIKLKGSPTELELTCCEAFLMYLQMILTVIFTGGLVFCCNWYNLSPFYAKVWTYFGKIVKVEQDKHGLHYNCNFALQSFDVSLKV